MCFLHAPQNVWKCSTDYRIKFEDVEIPENIKQEIQKFANKNKIY